MEQVLFKSPRMSSRTAYTSCGFREEVGKSSVESLPWGRTVIAAEQMDDLLEQPAVSTGVLGVSFLSNFVA